MRNPTKKEIEDLKAKFCGKRILLLRMDDPQAPPAGTIGTVLGVDDAGQILMQWDSGGSLALIPGEDQFEIL